MKYTEQAVETLDDSGGVIANKNIEIEQLHQRVAELEKQRDELLDAAEQVCHANNLTEAQIAVRVLNTAIASVKEKA